MTEISFYYASISRRDKKRRFPPRRIYRKIYFKNEDLTYYLKRSGEHSEDVFFFISHGEGAVAGFVPYKGYSDCIDKLKEGKNPCSISSIGKICFKREDNDLIALTFIDSEPNYSSKADCERARFSKAVFYIPLDTLISHRNKELSPNFSRIKQ